MDGPEPNWPKYFLLTHAIELAIKAYIISREDAGAPAPEFVAYWTNNGQKAALGLDLSAAIDPKRTLAASAPSMNECQSKKERPPRGGLSEIRSGALIRLP
jgi:hypothetical protein